MTELELANRLNVDLTVVNAWEMGEGIILLPTLEKMSKILNVSYEMILYGEERKPIKINHLKEEQQEIIIKLHKMMRNVK